MYTAPAPSPVLYLLLTSVGNPSLTHSAEDDNAMSPSSDDPAPDSSPESSSDTCLDSAIGPNPRLSHSVTRRL